MIRLLCTTLMVLREQVLRPALFAHGVLAACCLLSATTSASAQLPETFDVRATLDLCPEYRFGGVVLEVMYTTGIDPTLRAAEVIDQRINTSNGTARVTVRFPSTFGTVPFNLMAFCRNARGFSDSSNVLSVSNCDHLALYDTDGDGIQNNLEDLNCDNFFSPGDSSNPDNVDTDGDGVRDLVEVVSGTDPTNPGSSPRPYVYASSVFDPDADGDANPVVWRGSTGSWFLKDVGGPDLNVVIPFGQAGDVPFTYDSLSGPSQVGVIRRNGTALEWFFHGPGFIRSDSSSTTRLSFGIFGDNLLPGPWEMPGVTNPAVARLFNGIWFFYIYQSDGTIRSQTWGGNGDIPKVEDYDGDGLFDIAVFRPSTQRTFIIRSSDGAVEIYNFGTGTADHTVRGDYTGDGIDDISFWEPLTGVFTTLTSDNGFDTRAAERMDPDHYFELQLGLYQIHLPLNWNRRGGVLHYTVVDHAAGLRFWREGNNPTRPPVSLQWGIPGDHQG